MIARRTPSRAAWLSLLGVLTGHAATAEPSTAPDAGTAPDPGVVRCETPYPVGHRPRPDGAVQASVLDETVARWNAGGSSNPACPSSRASFHPAPRVMVDVEIPARRLPARSKAKGVLSETAVLAQTRSRGYWPFRLCSEAGLRRDPKQSGKTRLRISVGKDGRATGRKLSTELRDPAVATCLATHVHALRFSPPPRSRFSFDAIVDLSPGDAPLPDGPGSPEDAPGPPGKTGFDAGAAAAALDGALPAVSRCFDEGRKRDDHLWGRISLIVDATADGRIRSVRQHDSRFPDPAVLTCVIDAVRAVPLPKSGDAPVPFVFALRLGADPAGELPGKTPSRDFDKSSVADAVLPLVPLPH